VSVVGQSSVLAGSTCDLLVTSTDGRSKSVRLLVVDNPSPSYMCCGYPADGHGIWTVVNAYYFQPNPVVVDFAGDGGAGNGDLGGESAANPCAQCGTSEVCVQSFDGTCRLGTITCRPVSAACRTKLTASGGKDCKAISECETEFCTSPMRCVYNSPCGTEAPEAQLYCYGP